jgi:hypothetical protein
MRREALQMKDICYTVGSRRIWFKKLEGEMLEGVKV